jgi:hypothetical protein
MQYRVELYDVILLRTVVVFLDASSKEEAERCALERVKFSKNFKVKSVEEVDPYSDAYTGN